MATSREFPPAQLIIKFAVNDELSLSYTIEESEVSYQTSATTAYDIDMRSIQAAYSLGGATLSIARADNDNIGYANGVDASDTIVALAFAFASALALA